MQGCPLNTHMAHMTHMTHMNFSTKNGLFGLQWPPGGYRSTFYVCTGHLKGGFCLRKFNFMFLNIQFSVLLAS